MSGTLCPLPHWHYSVEDLQRRLGCAKLTVSFSNSENGKTVFCPDGRCFLLQPPGTTVPLNGVLKWFQGIHFASAKDMRGVGVERSVSSAFAYFLTQKVGLLFLLVAQDSTKDEIYCCTIAVFVPRVSSSHLSYWICFLSLVWRLCMRD